MSAKSFEKFMAELGRNAALRNEVKALARDENGVPFSEVAKLAAGKGYSFSVEDVSSELSDEQLDAVAGGLKWQPLNLTADKVTLAGVSLGYPTTSTTQFPKVEMEPYLKFF